jgi:PAS domain S-box-containing protein
MPVPCLLLDPDLNIMAVSDRYLRDTMTRRADLVGQNAFAAFPENPDDPHGGALANSQDSFDRVRRSLTSDTMPALKFDVRRPASEGGRYEVRYWRVVNAPVLGPGGTLAYILHQAEDITEYVRLTEQKQELTANLQARAERMEAEIFARSRDLENANRALRQLAVPFERQVEGAPDATVVVDATGTIVLVNEQAEVMFGYPRQELVGAPIELLVPESAREVHVKGRAAYAADPQVRTMGSGLELSGRRRDGTQFPISVALYCADREQGLVVASVRDITARQRTEAELGQLAAIVKHADDGIYTVTGAGVITAWNRGAERLFGYSEKEIIGQMMTLLAPPGLEDDALRLVRGTISTGQTARVETIRVRKDGSLVDVALSISALRDAAGSITAAATIAQDITARKRAEKRLAEQARKLEASNLELEQFAYVASHDLQEPLRKVSSFCQLLAQQYQGRLDGEADEYIGYVVDGAHRMQQLIDDLLAYSRVGRTGEGPVDVDCNEVMRRVRLDLAAAIEETGAQVVTGELPTVRGELPRLVQLFENLVGNAIKFRGGQPPRIEVSATRGDGAWQFCVADNGIGIEPQYADRIFAVFQRLHSRDEYPGTGIGLAICKKIVETHGGRIWLSSRPGRGTRFCWTIPARERP